MNKIMVLKGGSPALHKLGDIGRKQDDLIRVHSETDTHYIGNFEEGYGYIDVKFKKEDCRPLNEEERKELNGSWFGINGLPMYRMYVDEEGNMISGKGTMIQGVIDTITDSEGNQKHKDWFGWEVSFQEDIQIGKSLPLFTNDLRVITTSSVTNAEILGDIYVIHTRNSVYYIKVKNS